MRRIVVSMHDKIHAEIHHFVEEANAAQSGLKFEHTRLTEKEKKTLYRNPIDSREALKAISSVKKDRGLRSADILIAVVEGNVQDQEDDEYFYVSSLDYYATGSCGGLLSLYFLNKESTFMKDAAEWWHALEDSERKRISSDSVLSVLLCGIAAELTPVDCHRELRGCVMDYCQTPTEIVEALEGGFRFCRQVCQPSLEKHPEGQMVIRIAKWLTQHPFRYRRLLVGEFDVFMCHNSADKPTVRKICEKLKERGIRPWLDEEQLRPGYPWQRSLEDQIRKIRAAAVFVGPSGTGPWQNLELEAFIRQFVTRRCPVIPCILPEVSQVPNLPVFLEGMAWVDFRKSEANPIGRLFWGITGARF